LDATEAYQQGQTDRLMQGLADRLAAEEEATNQQIEFQERLTQAEKEESAVRQQIAEEEAAAKIATLQGVASFTSGMMNTLADLMESDGKNSEKNAKKIKALRIASATIDMLNGAVSAFTSAQSLGPIAGPIVGAANAAAVVAMGIANINKIKSTNVSGNGGSGESSNVAAPKTSNVAAPKTSAVVSAPNVETQMNTTRQLTSASEEDRLNRMASPQKVYILQSDIEAAGSQSKVQIEETSF
jgi:hypothetical protein